MTDDAVAHERLQGRDPENERRRKFNESVPEPSSEEEISDGRR